MRLLYLIVAFSLFSSVLANKPSLDSSRELKAARIDEQRKIMKSLGLGVPRTDPNRRVFLVKKYSAPKFMLNLFNELQNEPLQGNNELYINSSRSNYITERKYLNEAQVDTVISFFKYEHEHSQNNSHEDIKIKFHTKINDETEHVQGGEFKLYKRRPRTSSMPDILCNISVYKILAKNDRELLDTRVARAWTASWISFNITLAIKEWVRHPLTNRGLQVVVADPRGQEINPHEFGIVSSRRNKEKRPYLVSFVNTARDFSTFSQEILESRDRRSTRENSLSRKKPCHLKKFYVNFKKIGLHKTIIAPHGYHAYLCKGSCMYPIVKGLNATNHALLQSMAHLILQDVPDPCCSPYNLKPLSILYFDNDNNVVLTLHPNMVATSCACQ